MTSKQGKNQSSSVSQSSPLIVIADDDPSIRLILHHILEKEGYRVLEATNGLEALRLNQQHNPDLVILDAVMPEQDGFTTCKILKAKQPSLPVVMITALDDDTSVERAFQVGADDYITKPINWSVLKHRMAQTLLNPRNVRSSGDVSELSRLIETGQLQLTFHPRIDLTTEKSSGLRICYHHDGLDLSKKLITVALSDKLIGQLLELTCECFKTLIDKGMEIERLCIPMFYCATRPDHYITSLQNVAARYGLDLTGFDVAVSEQLLSQPEYSKQTSSLMNIPVHLVLDDFSFSLGIFDYLEIQKPAALSINIPRLAKHMERYNYQYELFRDLLLPLKNRVQIIATDISHPEDIDLANKIGCSHGEGPAMGKTINI